MKVIDISYDRARRSLSMITKMTLAEYKSLAYASFEKNGSLEGQRGVIKKSAAAARIRKRMNDDFVKGAIFPQVVIGVTKNIDDFKEVKTGDEIQVSFFNELEVSIIDGMQRSNIYDS